MSDQFVAEIRIFGFNFAPAGWALCHGQILPLSQNTALFSLLGTNYGGDGKSTFGLPNLQDAVPMHAGFGEPAGLTPLEVGETSGSETVTLLPTEMPAHTHTLKCDTSGGNDYGPTGDYPSPEAGGDSDYALSSNAQMSPFTLAAAGQNVPHNNLQPYLVMNYCIALQGIFPPEELIMASPYLGEVRIFSFGFAPKGWALCAGQLLAIQQNQALFALLGTTYGGNGQTTFALPDLRGRVAMGFGSHPIGQSAGESNHTLIVSELPAHSHTPACSSAAGTAASPANAFWAREPGGNALYASQVNTTLGANIVNNTGGSQAHQNMMPYGVVNFCMAMLGIFPSQN